jgi:sugar/nucleoside kinase (ribokinase family)
VEGIEVPARKARCVDATGGGDAFTAGALAVLLSGGDWTKALRVGHILGAKAVSKVGAVRGLTGLEKVRWQTPSTRPRR